MPMWDLLRKPWIPNRDLDGNYRELGLRDTLLRAHELKEIRDPLPIVEFGLYRLLVALVMDINQEILRDQRDLEELLEAGRFDAERVDKYFADNADRFDLFHEEHPFLQFAEMRGEADKPLSGLMPPIPSGTNANHFHHAHEDDFGVCPEAAARLLTTIAPFMTAGGAGLAPSINGAPPWYALVTGDSLFQTLCLNCCVAQNLQQENDGAPAWKRKGPFVLERRQSATLLEGLTWQPRRILLNAGGPGICALTGKQSDTLVRSMKFGPGAAAGFPWTDPNVAYRIDAAKGPMVRRPQEGRQVWRDVGALALLQSGERGKDDAKSVTARPAVVDQYATLFRDASDLVPSDLRLTLYGMRTDLKMKVFEWQRESLEPLPAPLALLKDFGTVAQMEMERADKVDGGLARALKCAYPRDGKGNKKAFDSRIDYARRCFWNALRPHYMNLLTDLAEAYSDPDQYEAEKKRLTDDWKGLLRHTGRRILDEAIRDLDTEGDMMVRTEVIVRNEFSKALFFALEEPGSNVKGRKKTGTAGAVKGEQTA